MSDTVHRGPDAAHGCLTLREVDLLRLLAEGKCSKEIAEEWKLSVKTVETHRTHILRKLRVSSTIKAVIRALRQRILALEIDEFHGS